MISVALVNHGLVKWLPVSHLVYGFCSQFRCFSGGLLSSPEENTDIEKQQEKRKNIQWMGQREKEIISPHPEECNNKGYGGQ